MGSAKLLPRRQSASFTRATTMTCFLCPSSALLSLPGILLHDVILKRCFVKHKRDTLSMPITKCQASSELSKQAAEEEVLHDGELGQHLHLVHL